MLKSITRFSVRYPVTVSMIILATLLLGYISFGKLGIDLFPNLHSPRLYVDVRSGERPPEEMEDRFVDRIEALAIRQSGVVNVSSVSRVGVAQIEVEYSWEKDMNEAFLDLSKALAAFNQDEELDELNITQFDPNADPVMLVGFRHQENSNLEELRSVAENYVRNELIRLEGIADVAVDGAEEMEILIETSDYMLASYNIDLATITARINSYNQNISGGSIVEMGRRYIVRGLSELEQIDDLKDVIIRMAPAGGGEEGERVPVLLRDVATVTFSPKEKENAVTINGEACIGLSIYKEMRYNTVKAVEDLKGTMKEMEKSLPGYTFTIVEDQGNFISGAIGEVRDSLIGGIILAVFVLMLFLRRIGPTAIVSIAIPISIIATFVLMYFTGLTLNIMTLGGLALGAGMLVDNAIVVLENIFRNHEAGVSTDDAAVAGTTQVGGAIIASTLTTIVVFVPIVYLHGASGELFREQAITVAFSLLCSLFVAILIIPMLYSRLYRKRHPFTGKARRSVKFTGYGRMLDRILDRNVWVLLGASLLMVAGWFMLKQTGSEFMPQTDTREFYVDLRMPEGSRLERTMGAVQSIEEMIRGVAGDEVEMIYSEIGPTSGLASGGENVFDDQNMATIKVLLKDKWGGNKAGNKAGNTSGKTAGNTTGKTAGKTAGNTAGNTAGKTAGNTAGNIAGNTAGNIAGNTAGNTAGNIAGNIAGNTAGNAAGNAAGNTAGNTAGIIASLSAYYEGAQNYSVQFRQEETALQTILGTAGAPLIIELRGKEMDALEQLTQPVMEKLHGIKGVYNIASSIEGGAPEVEILIDRYQAGLMNVDVNTLISRVSEKLQGVDAGEMNVKGEMTDITVKLGDISLRELEMLTIEVNNASVLLRELAEIRIGTAPREILHNNQNRIVEITSDLAEDVPLDQMAVKIDAALSEIDFPADYTYSISGEEAMRKDSVGNLLFALLLSLVLVYMVLAAQFESLVHPFTILLTVPLAVVGAVAIFFIMGKALNIMAIIGIIMLVGIAVNDSIILVDAINQFRREGMPLKDSIIAAGQRRIRPIIMTSLTTILALLPLTFGFGESASLRSPMAWAVIGGLVTSTLLTLVVIPSIYMLLARLEPKRIQTEESE